MAGILLMLCRAGSALSLRLSNELASDVRLYDDLDCVRMMLRRMYVIYCYSDDAELEGIAHQAVAHQAVAHQAFLVQLLLDMRAAVARELAWRIAAPTTLAGLID